jgi:GDP-L-fucose synthase
MQSKPEMTLILGADGFLGRHFCHYFAARGWPFYPVGRSAGDFSIRENVAKAFKSAPEASRILHLITHQRTGQIQYDIPGSLLFENTNIHLNVLECWRLYQPQAKLISTGSSCAFPESDKALPEEAFQRGQVHKSVRGYALAKQVLAVGSEAYSHEYGLKYLHLCLATIYGPNDYITSDRSHFMTGMINRAVKEKEEGKKAFTVWGAPNTVRDLLYVDDQMEAILAADNAFENCLLNCGSNEPVTIHQSAQAIIEALDWQAELYYPPDSFAGANYKTLDCNRFLTKTGWQPKMKMVEGVREVLRVEAAARKGELK